MVQTKQIYELIIIGAGGAGLMAGITAAKLGIKSIIIDSATKLCEKIRISGGGRCNFTNINASAHNYISQNPHFCKSALSQFSAQDFIDMVESHGIKYHEKKLGQLFCNEGSSEIIEMLLGEYKSLGGKIYHPIHISNIEVLDENDFLLCSKNQDFRCSNLVIATGGLSIPQIGASDFGHRFAKKLKLKVIEPRPALVPLLLTGHEHLSGVSIDAEVSTKDISFRENILFTHKGLSGPAILQISSYIKKGDELNINLAPDYNLKQSFLSWKNQDGKAKLKTLIKKLERKPNEDSNSAKINSCYVFPDKFINHWAEKYDLELRIAEYPNSQLEKIANSLNSWKIISEGDEGFKKAEVTRGGICTNELSSKSMECKKYPGLYFIGEVVDVTGWLGGYNFQWAWASGYVAANNIARQK